MAPTLSRRQTLAAALAVAALPRLAWAQGARAVPDMTIGDANAPVTVVEYAMFTCPHCADFYKEVFPKLKAEYIDTGKVRLVFREVYFNRPSLWAAMIARCAPADRYFGIADVLFSQQLDWAGQTDEQALIQKLYAIGRQAGLSDAEMDACMNDRGFAEALVAEYQKNAKQDGIDATPTFIVNGQKVDNLPWDEFKAKIDAALGT
ncbi:MAG: DsbA family protein [Amaricoccus sp.]